MQTLKGSLFCFLAAILVSFAAAGCSADAKKSRALTQANSYFESGEYDKAKIEYLNVLKMDPQDVTAVERLGTIWYEQGAPLHAAPFFLRTRDLAPDSVDARAKLSLILLSVGQVSEARKEAVDILDRSPAHDEAMLVLAEASRNQRDIDDAERRLRSIHGEGKAGLHLALAALSLRKKDLASAQSAVKHALSLDPNSIEAHLALGKIYWSKRDLSNADQEFKSAAQLAPPRSTAGLIYAEFKARTGRTAEAKAQLSGITRDAPDFLPAWRLLAQIALAEKQFDESLSLVETVILRDPVNIEARLIQAQVMLAKGEVHKAIENLEGLNTSFPKVPAIKYQLARAYLQNDNAPQATASLNQAVELNRDYAEAILLLGEVNLRNGNAQPVVASMASLRKRRPDLVQAQIILAQAYHSLGRLDDATAIFNERIKVSPQDAQPYLLLGLVLRQQNKIDEARNAFEDAQRLTPDDLLVVAQLIDLDIQTRDFDAALQRVNEQMRKTPESPGAHFLAGRVYAAQGQSDRAEAALRKTLELDPKFSSAYDLLLSIFIATNQLPQAVTLLESGLSRNPGNTRALMVLGQTYERMKDFAKARDTYEKVLSIKADSPSALNNLAYLYAERFDQLDKAYDLAQKARTLEPANPAIADTFGWILYKKRDYQQALTTLQESAHKLPKNPEIQFHLGMASYMMGRVDEARRAFLQAAASADEFSGKDEVQRRLSLLEMAEGKAVELSSSDLKAILERQPDDPLTRTLLGESYEKQRAFAEAAAAYEQAVNLNPKLLSATVRLAELNAGPLQASEKALEFAKKARELAPNDPKMVGLLGSAAYQTGNFAWAYSLLQESARQLPDDPEILYDLAWAAYSLGKVAEAQQSMQSLLAAAPNSSQSSDAKLFLEMATPDEELVTKTAHDDVESVLKTNPGYVPALMAQAALLAKRSESKAAIKIYIEVLHRFPDFAPAQKRLASLYQGTPEKRDEAYDLAVKARKALPDDPELAQILAKLSYDRNEFAYAVQLLKQSAERRPLDAQDLYYLGMSQLKGKDKIQSRETLSQALSAGLQNPLATEARRALAELEAN